MEISVPVALTSKEEELIENAPVCSAVVMVPLASFNSALGVILTLLVPFCSTPIANLLRLTLVSLIVAF